jgi:hypothetical protein
MIIQPLLGQKPDVVTFWGVGSPESDVDLLEIFKGLCTAASNVELVNPNAHDAKKMEDRLARPVMHYQRRGRLDIGAGSQAIGPRSAPAADGQKPLVRQDR